MAESGDNSCTALLQTTHWRISIVTTSTKRHESGWSQTEKAEVPIAQHAATYTESGEVVRSKDVDLMKQAGHVAMN